MAVLLATLATTTGKRMDGLRPHLHPSWLSQTLRVTHSGLRTFMETYLYVRHHIGVSVEAGVAMCVKFTKTMVPEATSAKLLRASNNAPNNLHHSENWAGAVLVSIALTLHSKPKPRQPSFACARR